MAALSTAFFVDPMHGATAFLWDFSASVAPG